MSNCEKFLQLYLELIGIVDAKITTNQDTLGFLLVVEISRKNNEKIGILKGKNGKNIIMLKQILRVIGFLEKKNPFILVKLID
jgi:hypothetical protein